MNPENRWVKKVAMIPWNEIEDKYAKLFPSKTGMPAKRNGLIMNTKKIKLRFLAALE